MIYHILLFTIFIGIFIYINSIITSYEGFIPYKESLNTDNVNEDLYSNTIISQNTDQMYEENITKILLHKNDINNMIKYIEGISWNEWSDDINNNIQNTNNELINDIKTRIDNRYELISYKINKFREEKNNDTNILIDINVILSKNASPKLFNVKILYITDIITNEFKIIYVKLYGIINEEELYHQNKLYYNVNDNQYSLYNQMNENISDIDDENLEKDDEKTIKVLYNNIMKNDIDSEDYIKNIEYTKNQDIIQKMFLNKLQKPQPIKSNYTQYPISNDFTIS